MDSNSVDILKENKALYINLDSIPIPCILFDEDSIIIEANIKAAALFELKTKQDLYNNFCSFIYACKSDENSAKEQFSQVIRHALESGCAYLDWTFIKPDGEQVPAEIVLSRTNYDNRNVVAAYLNDLRELKKSISEIEESARRMQIILDATPLSAVFFDEEFNKIDCNQEAVNLFELKDKQEYLERFNELSPKYQPDGHPSEEKIIEYIKKAFDTGRCVFEWMLQKLDGEPIPAEVTLVRVKYANRNVVIFFTRDLREIKTTYSMLQQYKSLAFTDNLTGVYNRHYFIESAQKSLFECRCTSQPLSIILFDFDYFKNINDVHGHSVGDEMLKAVISKVKAVLRPTDILARYGGDEFIILLSKTPGHIAEKIAWRIRDIIDKSSFKVTEREIHQTISLGISENIGDDTIEQTILKADEALYRAKQNGRNTVVIF